MDAKEIELPWLTPELEVQAKATKKALEQKYLEKLQSGEEIPGIKLGAASPGTVVWKPGAENNPRLTAQPDLWEFRLLPLRSVFKQFRWLKKILRDRYTVPPRNQIPARVDESYPTNASVRDHRQGLKRKRKSKTQADIDFDTLLGE